MGSPPHPRPRIPQPGPSRLPPGSQVTGLQPAAGVSGEASLTSPVQLVDLRQLRLLARRPSPCSASPRRSGGLCPKPLPSAPRDLRTAPSLRPEEPPRPTLTARPLAGAGRCQRATSAGSNAVPPPVLPPNSSHAGREHMTDAETRPWASAFPATQATSAPASSSPRHRWARSRPSGSAHRDGGQRAAAWHGHFGR